MRVVALPCLIIALSWFAPTPVAASDAEDSLPPWASSLTRTPQLSDRVVQQRKYEMDHELSIMVGALPSDPFFKGISGTLGYTLHINEFLAWEIISATYAFDIDTDLKRNALAVAADSGLPVPPLPEVNAYGASHLVLKPFYGKQAVRDVALIHLELSLLLGPAGVLVDNLGAKSFTFGADWAIAFRVWVNEVVSVRAQLGQLIYYFSGATHEEFHAEAGFSFNLGGDG